ncbi:copper tolerance protein [Hyphomonas polymorpha PS728]|uniref:Copper tolerance protein n=2 Tax=Hyphomonas polymorpha TaxID=74319 RepID=A0A062VGF5_9PROT|nr:copper tolerance protein [Hyphomonas polymorpha PS728]
MDEAVALAFLTSPRLQAELEVLGIARADLISSVLPTAPFLEISRPTSGNILSLDVSASLLDLIFWPQRAQAGKAAMEAAQARAAAVLADAAADVRIAFIEHTAAVQALDLYRQAEAAGQAAQLAAEAMFEAGNIARVDYDRQRQFAAQMTAERMRAEGQVGPTRERLIAILGLTQERAEKLQLVSRLPAPAEAALDTGRLIGAAMDDSLQVAAAEADMRQMAAGRGLRNIEALMRDAEFGAEFERDGSWSDESYSLGLALPVDLGVAGRQRVASEMRQAFQRLHQARLDSLADIRSSAQTAESARALALFHRDVSLPVSAEVFDGVVRDFNAMQIGMFELLQSRRDRVDAGRDYLEAVTDYWRARAELERHVRVSDFESGADTGNEDDHPQSEEKPVEHSPPDPNQHQGHDHG